jgi:hypothetical protein
MLPMSAEFLAQFISKIKPVITQKDQKKEPGRARLLSTTRYWVLLAINCRGFAAGRAGDGAIHPCLDGVTGAGGALDRHLGA